MDSNKCHVVYSTQTFKHKFIQLFATETLLILKLTNILQFWNLKCLFQYVQETLLKTCQSVIHIIPTSLHYLGENLCFKSINMEKENSCFEISDAPVEAEVSQSRDGRLSTCRERGSLLTAYSLLTTFRIISYFSNQI